METNPASKQGDTDGQSTSSILRSKSFGRTWECKGSNPGIRVAKAAQVAMLITYVKGTSLQNIWSLEFNLYPYKS